ncbi:MAG: DUF4149 domain-containing protein [Alphaproteobacteria bacterium]|jgi:hypothetical protein|nr:DUF4149 domain-containing protein [Alphaproteobacteria bacterium]
MLLNAIALYATAILLGTMLFFSFAMTPVIFAKLEPEQAARTVRALFPVYYLVIILCGAVGALTLALDQQPVPSSLLAVVAGFALLTRQFVIPRLDALRDAKTAGDAVAVRQFKRLHGLSMAVNLAQIVAVLVVLSTFVH